MAQHGGKRPGAGRPKGSTSRATKEAKERLSSLAKEHAPAALEALVRVMNDEDQSGAAVVAAANSILDRAYGKAPTAEPERDDEAPPVSWVIDVRASKGQVRVTKSE